MNHDLESLSLALVHAPAIRVSAQLTRLVPFLDLVMVKPANWLYASGRPNRYNPAGTHCVYFAETIEVARAEYEQYWQGLVGEDQPVTTYHAEVRLERVLDVTNAATLKALKLTSSQLFKVWRMARHPTVTQLLGQAVNETRLFSAIKFPSKAARAAGFAGANIVIFPDCIRPPSELRILGRTRKALQRLP